MSTNIVPDYGRCQGHDFGSMGDSRIKMGLCGVGPLHERSKLAVPDDFSCPRKAIGYDPPNHTRVLEFAKLARVFRGEMKRSKG